MDKNKNQGGNQAQRTQDQGNQGQPTQGEGHQGHGSQPQNPNRDQAEGERQGTQSTHTPERGRRSQKSERNSSSSGSGISNRGMDRDEEQEDVPVRGSERGDSER
jgi:hypothetical protein